MPGESRLWWRVRCNERLERLVAAYEAAVEAAGATWDFSPRAPASDEELDEIEASVGRLLPQEAREMYRWHNGLGSWLAPEIDFSHVDLARELYSIQCIDLPAVSNACQEIIPVGVLFRVLNLDKVTLDVATTVDVRAPTSRVYYLDFEMGLLTCISETITDLIEEVTIELQRGGVHRHGGSVRGAFAYSPDMVPFGHR